MFDWRAMMPILGLGLGWAPAAAQDFTFFSIGSGDITGGYYEAAQEICAAVNRESRTVRCSPEPTSGSLYNLSALTEGQIEFALAQSDWHRSAYEGEGLFAGDGAMPQLRSVIALYPEAVTVLARKAAEIDSLSDLAGLRVDLGHPASGRLPTLTRLLEDLDFPPSNFRGGRGLPASVAIEALCNGRIDATILVVGHPNAAVQSALSECEVEIVPFEAPGIREAMAGKDDYVPTTISQGAYPQLEADVATYAVIATLVTVESVPDELVSPIVRATLAQLPALRSNSPLLRNLDAPSMRRTGLTAPLHDAAEAAFDSLSQGTPFIPPN